MISPEDLTVVRFPVVRGRGGYLLADVDDVLDEIAAAMRSGKIPVRVTGFRASRFLSEGYAVDAVDELLEQLRMQGAVTF